MNIKTRNIVVSLILSFVTCGIYALYWVFASTKEALALVGKDDILTVILCMFIPFIGFFLFEKKFAEGCAEQGIEHKENAILYLILGLVFPIALPCLVQNELNKQAA